MPADDCVPRFEFKCPPTIVDYDFGIGACGTSGFGAFASRLAKFDISLRSRARAKAVVCSADTGGVANSNVALSSASNRGVRGERLPYGAVLPSPARTASSATEWMPSSVASVCFPWSSIMSSSAASIAGLIDINCRP
eukprot:5000480-Pleurochrysis_carterae.AAC.3